MGYRNNTMKNLPVSHKLHKGKARRPQSPMEVLAEEPGVRLLKTKGAFFAEISTAISEENKKPTTSAILRQEMEEDLEL